MHAPTEARGLPAAVRRRLRTVLGPDGLIEAPGRLLAYESDALTTRSGIPRAVLLPGDGDALAASIRILAEAGIPFTPRGSGTGLSGGAVADGTVLLGTARMREILEIDPVGRWARVEPGVVTDRISEAAAPYGLRYLPDPASASACTVGGNVATNAGGPHCLRHGVTSDHVLELEVVLPDGTGVRLDRGESGGLDLAGLWVGSEGTLGVVAEIRVALHPLAPDVVALLAVFDDLGHAGAAVSRVFEAGIVPVALELIDGATIRVVEASEFAAGLPPDAAAALVVECEGEPDAVRSEIEAVAGVCRDAGASRVRTATDEAERTAIWQARKKAYGALGRLAPDVLVQDAVVPRTALERLLPRIEQVAERHDLRLANFFHAGDGNLHPNLLFDHRDEEQVERVERASAEIMRLCVDAGGTITGEHGVGLDKVRYMSLLFGEEELAAQARLRNAVDPAGLANPGKLLPE